MDIKLRKVCLFYLNELSHGNQVVHENGLETLEEDLVCAYELLSSYQLINMDKNRGVAEPDIYGNQESTNDLVLCITQIGLEFLKKHQKVIDEALKEFNPHTASVEDINEVLTFN